MLTRTALGAASLLLIPAAALSACGASKDADGAPAAQPTADSTCTYAKSGQAAKPATLPESEPTVKGAQHLTIHTSQGDIPVTLDADAAPCTVNSFVSLARQGYYDKTTCHRFINDFMVQCGDPSATGMGGPGYSFPDELTGKETYPLGTLAMANAGPDTNGSQFFMMVADYPLQAQYTVFGKVDPAGLKVLAKINKGGNGPDGVAPSPAVDISSIK
ncbi:peptidylprolyl isomerase [Nocardioides jiangxiensis]|uniref:Peptidyl-prolyl cis-trans isomerase n=1 Tax=Nocardioides jiangxiensis TaxID=3064524 RepID=A0ABT9B0K8_9ACTN|nr:peptidylprolyl isomerase [Nocardioides sp. WY-20]MDO7866806.1 peptidylprolyl isomerase [Nocardioides sp. WY-20]